MKLRGRTLLLQFWLAGALVFIFATFSLAVVIFEINRQADNSQWLDQVHRTSGQLKFLLRDFYREKIDFKNYVRTWQSRNLQLFRQDRQTFFQTLESIREGHSRLSGSDALLNQIEKEYTKWESETDRIVSTRDFRKRVRLGLDAQEKAIRKAIQATVDHYEAILSNQSSVEKRKVRRFFLVSASVNLFLLLTFAVILTRLYFSIARPVSELTRATERYRGGDLSARVETTGQSQIGYLQSSFNEMAKSVEAMVEDLRKLDELKSDFVSTVSHELRTPLTSIGGYIKLLLSEDAGEVSATQREFLSIVDSNVDRLTALINDLLDVEKIQSGRMDVVVERVDLRRVLEISFETLRVLADRKGIGFQMDLPDQPIEVSIDSARMVQVFTNLFSNAVKYTKEGTVKIDVETNNLGVLVRIKDTGSGMSEGELNNLFQKFYRTRSAVASDVGGTGLGLVIVQELVDLHGGNISVESQVGEGSTFVVTLPLASAGVVAENAVSRVDLPEDVESGGVIWLVNKNSDEVAQIEEMLQSDLKATLVVLAGVDDLRHYQGGRPDAVILDSESESFSLEEGVRILRDRFDQDLPVVSIGRPSDTVEALSSGAAAYLTRPIRRTRLVTAVRNVMGGRSIRILIAEQDPDLRFLVKRALEQRGFQVDDVVRGEQVLRRLKLETYHFVIIERDFSDVDGLEILKFVRKDAALMDLPVAVFSEDLEDEQILLDFGVIKILRRIEGIGPVVELVCRYFDEKKISQLH